MLNLNEVIFVAFKFINFFIIVFILYYVFKKYMLGDLRNSIRSNINYLKSLYDELKHKTIQSKYLKQSYNDQQYEIEVLDKKLFDWGESCINQKERQKYLDEKIQEQISLKRKVQEENFATRQLKKNIIPKVINCSKQKLIQKFQEDENAAKEYVDKLISFIQKG